MAVQDGSGRFRTVQDGLADRRCKVAADQGLMAGPGIVQGGASWYIGGITLVTVTVQ